MLLGRGVLMPNSIALVYLSLVVEALVAVQCSDVLFGPPFHNLPSSVGTLDSLCPMPGVLRNRNLVTHLPVPVELHVGNLP
ncbi:hypothetical protein F4860DRAFT_459093 [Xylaria cubensis]|nr:hypothetical protein F4860DRAFT_459093 [Xylaria cubensis]